jgi:hypothetical protein
MNIVNSITTKHLTSLQDDVGKSANHLVVGTGIITSDAKDLTWKVSTSVLYATYIN